MRLHYPNRTDFEVKDIAQRIKTKLEVVANAHNVPIRIKLPDRNAIKNEWCTLVTK